MAARSLNKVILIGNLTRDPELRYTPSGTPVCTFGLATNRDWVDGSGQKQEEAEFHNIVAWGKLGEICDQLLFKGRKIYVEGRLSTRTWNGQDGNERKATEVVIEEMIAFGPGKGGEEEESMHKNAIDTSSMMSDEPVNLETKNEDVEVPSEAKTDAQEVADDIPF